MSGDPTRRAALAAQQAELVAALVTGGAPPDGVDAHRLAVAADALLRKRAGEVAWHWPALLANSEAHEAFVAWARLRPRAGAFVDGWGFAEHLEQQGALDAAGRAELAAVRRAWTRGADGAPRRRRRPRASARAGRWRAR